MSRDDFSKNHFNLTFILNVLNEGENLGSRIFLFYTVQLYFYDKKYIEIWYHQYDRRIDRVVEIDDDAVLDLYEIKLPEF